MFVFSLFTSVEIKLLNVSLYAVPKPGQKNQYFVNELQNFNR